jgi:hypothetical protein
MDEIDQAQEKIEIGLEDAIRHARAGGPVAVATGRCLWCDEVLGDGQRWCHGCSCRDSWEREQRMKNGRI